MVLSDVYTALGEERLRDLLRHVSISKLKTFQMFDRLKLRTHLTKLNSETLRNASPKLLKRIAEGDETLATELAQCILVSHMEMIVAVLNQLGVDHTDGFFDKDADVASKLTDGWRERVYAEQSPKFPKNVLVFYLNHLAAEVTPDAAVYVPEAA